MFSNVADSPSTKVIVGEMTICNMGHSTRWWKYCISWRHACVKNKSTQSSMISQRYIHIFYNIIQCIHYGNYMIDIYYIYSCMCMCTFNLEI